MPYLIYISSDCGVAHRSPYTKSWIWRIISMCDSFAELLLAISIAHDIYKGTRCRPAACWTKASCDGNWPKITLHSAAYTLSRSIISALSFFDQTSLLERSRCAVMSASDASDRSRGTTPWRGSRGGGSSNSRDNSGRGRGGRPTHSLGEGRGGSTSAGSAGKSRNVTWRRPADEESDKERGGLAVDPASLGTPAFAGGGAPVFNGHSSSLYMGGGSAMSLLSSSHQDIEQEDDSSDAALVNVPSNQISTLEVMGEDSEGRRKRFETTLANNRYLEVSERLFHC